PEMLDEAYTDIKARMNRLGAEYILITPHFTTPYWMGFDDMRAAKENRSYVFYALDWAEKNGYGIADASSRWAHLGKEGIHYITFLGNTLNHPNDYGHKMFAEELMKCFK
ncbi:MAG: SGNH/GDSL hydrolase family protein, partial [Abditibacteriota bacterium]|nr:SGNH/GDSL hydrolase family protein [Abditibacteriota bacterium]